MAFSLGLIILFFASMFQSCSELKHSLWGIETTGEVASVEPSLHSKNGLYVSFFMQDDAGQRQRIKRTVSKDLGPFTIGQQVDVIYLAGSADNARLVAERSWFWPLVFFVMLGAIVVWVVVVWLQTERM